MGQRYLRKQVASFCLFSYSQSDSSYYAGHSFLVDVHFLVPAHVAYRVIVFSA